LLPVKGLTGTNGQTITEDIRFRGERSSKAVPRPPIRKTKKKLIKHTLGGRKMGAKSRPEENTREVSLDSPARFFKGKEGRSSRGRNQSGGEDSEGPPIGEKEIFPLVVVAP